MIVDFHPIFLASKIKDQIEESWLMVNHRKICKYAFDHALP